MLFDEKDLSVFENEEARDYFKEVLQLYYGQNYRAAIVTLYSFVIYDLFIKLQTMANEGDSKAEKKVKEINSMISDDEKYSKVETEIVQFYNKNCSLYFNRFNEDIDYLRNCRNKCAHLKVNDNSLYKPSDYHVRMLICSMYDNILSVKAPFITDLFSLAKADVENYARSITYISKDGLDNAIYNEVKNKYLARMTYDALVKSYKTFVKLLFIVNDEDCKKNIFGLYAFTYSITQYALDNGYLRIFEEVDIVRFFSKITVDSLNECPQRRISIGSLMIKFPILMDLMKSNTSVFEDISKRVLTKPTGLELYRIFYPRSEKTMYEFFLENEEVQNAAYTERLYQILKDCTGFSAPQFMKVMIARVPRFNGFDDADAFIDSFKKHLEELSIEDIEDVMKIYKRNDQCVNRGRHSTDSADIRKYIEKRREEKGVDEEQLKEDQ